MGRDWIHFELICVTGERFHPSTSKYLISPGAICWEAHPFSCVCSEYSHGDSAGDLCAELVEAFQPTPLVCASIFYADPMQFDFYSNSICLCVRECICCYCKPTERGWHEIILQVRFIRRKRLVNMAAIIRPWSGRTSWETVNVCIMTGCWKGENLYFPDDQRKYRMMTIDSHRRSQKEMYRPLGATVPRQEQGVKSIFHTVWHSRS